MVFKEQLIEDKDKKIYSIFSKQFFLLNKLCTIYYENAPCKKEQYYTFEEIKREIKRLRQDEEKRDELEGIINDYMENIIAKIKEDFSDITPEDIHILCLIIAGFSGKAISVITGLNRDVVYAKKSRIKKLILNKETPNKETYMKYLFT